MRSPKRNKTRRLLAAGMILPLLVSTLASGCRWENRGGLFGGDPDLAYFRTVATDIEMPDVPSEGSGVQTATAPLTLNEQGPIDYWDLSLQECVQMALTNSQVMRDLGGLVLQSPENVETVYGPAVTETDPRFGLDAALAAFDTSFATSAFFDNNDRPLNNPFFIGGRTLKQDLGIFNTEFSKTTGQGTQLFFRHITDYDANNTPGNPFPSTWNTLFETEARQPLLQGFGAPFNRIAGPNATFGVYNGVLIARVNTDISLADFEMGVRNLVNDVESTYWELYFGYRDLDAKLSARQRALETWRRIHALNISGQEGGESDKEAQAREQYYRLDEEVQNALAGRLQDRTRTFTFRGVGGIQNNERRLRWLLGIPINDGRLIRPADEPLMAKVVFDWNEAISEAMMRRAELRKQKWQIKRRELELAASRNFLLPRLDAVALYRWRGFGKDLISANGGKPRFNNAWQDLLSGDFQEWQLGFEYQFPIGYRQAHAGVRNAELNLARERALLYEQERDVSLGLSEALADLDRAYQVAQTNFNARHAALEALSSFEAKYQVAAQDQKTQLLALVLDAQRKVADAESRYYRSLVEYTLAYKQVHFQKGSLLDLNEVVLSEGPWPDKAYRDAARRERLRGQQWQLMNFMSDRRLGVSQGSYIQQTASPDGRSEPYYPLDGTQDGSQPSRGAAPGGTLDGGAPGGPRGPAPPQPLPTPASDFQRPTVSDPLAHGMHAPSAGGVHRLSDSTPPGRVEPASAQQQVGQEPVAPANGGGFQPYGGAGGGYGSQSYPTYGGGAPAAPGVQSPSAVGSSASRYLSDVPGATSSTPFPRQSLSEQSSGHHPRGGTFNSPVYTSDPVQPSAYGNSGRAHLGG
jgi:hypothetical protein